MPRPPRFVSLTLRSLKIALLLLLTAWLVGGGAETAATDPPQVAGLVIDYGNGAATYSLIPLNQTEMSGLDLLKASGLNLLTVGSGGWGVAVCMIQEIGCDLNSCRTRLCQSSDPTSPFWRYLRAPDDDGAPWLFNNRGADSNPVLPGQVDAWFWTGTRPETPSVSVAEIADRLGVDLSDVGDEPITRTFGVLSITPTSPPSWESITASVAIVVATGVVGVWVIRRSGTTP